MTTYATPRLLEVLMARNPYDRRNSPARPAGQDGQSFHSYSQLPPALRMEDLDAAITSAQRRAAQEARNDAAAAHAEELRCSLVNAWNEGHRTGLDEGRLEVHEKFRYAVERVLRTMSELHLVANKRRLTFDMPAKRPDAVSSTHAYAIIKALVASLAELGKAVDDADPHAGDSDIPF